MDSPWFYSEAGQALGPVSLDELLGRLFAMPNPHAVLVWREGQGEWMQAGSLPEIGSRLPPPLSGMAGVARPAMSAGAAGVASRLKPVEDAEVIARLYRRLVLLVGSELLLGLFNSATRELTASLKLFGDLLLLVVVLAVVGTLVATAYRLADRLDAGPPILWAVGMFIPCLNIIVLLALSAIAQKWCKGHSIKVGLLGPTRESIEELRRSVSTSAFD